MYISTYIDGSTLYIFLEKERWSPIKTDFFLPLEYLLQTAGSFVL